MVICAGPTGAGKTTTLYATLREINSTGKNVTTVEDPVEYVFPGINQIQTNEQAGLTFATGLKAILRQDPDVILVGEIRDADTARIADPVRAHRSLRARRRCTAPTAVAALHRFLDMGIEAFLIASSVVGVIGQRLLRRICDTCKEPYTPGADETRRVPPAQRRQRQERVLPRRAAATTAPAPATATASACTSCCASRRSSAASSSAGPPPRSCAARRRPGHAHDAARGHGARRERRHHHPRSHPHPVRELTGAPPCPSSPTRHRCQRSHRRGRHQGRHDRRGPRRSSPSAEPRSADQVDQKRGALNFELTKEKVKKKELMHFSAPARRVRQGRHPDHRGARDHRRRDRGRRVVRKVIGAAWSSTPQRLARSRRRRAQAPRGLPDVLHRHPRVRRAHRQARRDAGEPGRLPRARDRDPLKVVVGARRIRWSSWCWRSSPSLILAGYVLPQFKPLFEELDAELPLPTRALLGMVADFFTRPLVRPGSASLRSSSPSSSGCRTTKARRLVKDRLAAEDPGRSTASSSTRSSSGSAGSCRR